MLNTGIGVSPIETTLHVSVAGIAMVHGGPDSFNTPPHKVQGVYCAVVHRNLNQRG